MLYRIAFIIIAILSCSVSLTLTLRLCWEVKGPGLVSAVVAIAIGLTLELSKYSLAPAGLRMFASGRRVVGCILVAIAVVLVLGSVGASVSYLVAASNRQIEEATRNSESYRAATARLHNLETEPEVLAETARRDAANNYRHRALQTAEALRKLRGQHAALQQTLSTTLHEPNAAAPTQQLAEAVGMPAHRLRLTLFAVMAGLVEALSMVAVLLLHAAPLQAREPQPQVALQAVQVDAAPVEPEVVPLQAPGPEPQDAAPEIVPVEPEVVPLQAPEPVERVEVEVAAPLDDPLVAAREQIVSGALAPVLRSVQQQLSISQRPAQRILKQLADEGVLHRDNRGRYCVATNGNGNGMAHAVT
jgi:cell division protein FtsB